MKGEKRGRFIALEGGEGTGKSTILKALEKALPPEKVIFTREPGGTKVAEGVRDLLLHQKMPVSDLAEFLLFWASRAEHVERIILPALLKGKHVISDRFDSSTFAYQIWARGRQSLVPTFDMLREVVCASAVPDLYIYLDVDPEIGFQRVGKRGEKDRIELEDMAFHKRVRAGYLTFFAEHDHYYVDASQPLAEVVSQVVSRVLEALEITALHA